MPESFAIKSQHSHTSNFLILLFLAMALMSALLNSTAPTPLYPFYQNELRLTSVSLSIIYGAYAAGVLISLLCVGNLTHRVSDLRYMIIPALFIVLTGAILFTIANSFMMLLFARLLAGIGTGALTGAANISLVKFGPGDQGKAAALIATLSFTTGLALGPILSGVAMQTNFHPTSFPFYVIMIFTFISLGGTLLTWHSSDNSVQKRVSEKHITPHSKSNSLKEGLRLTGISFFLCAASLFTCWAVAASLFAIGPTVSELLLNVHSRGVFGYVIAIYLIIAGISQILSRRVEAKHSLISGCIFQIISLFIFYISIELNSIVIACIGMAIAGYAYGAIFVGSATLINIISPKESHAKLLSLFYVIAYVANWVPVLLGIIIDHASLQLAVNLLFLISSVTFLILVIMIKYRNFKILQ
ncbi:MFS transporter [Tatumella sp. JGM118]|uniref:MFS transporter n=1 Tax=Tatumella sp. JGM118 TaxID=2799796 RepID=UPI001BAE970B|nr:MFS transporter [Tatumella sp. JGM118]MBS0908447.1 MFS transporter [Tatumella sp. JGM118]